MDIGVDSLNLPPQMVGKTFVMRMGEFWRGSVKELNELLRKHAPAPDPEAGVTELFVVVLGDHVRGDLYWSLRAFLDKSIGWTVETSNDATLPEFADTDPDRIAEKYYIATGHETFRLVPATILEVLA